MALDTRFDLITLLARHRQSFVDWLERNDITSYDALCKKTDVLGARPVPRNVYDAAAQLISAKKAAVVAAVEKIVIEQPISDDEKLVEDTSLENQDESDSLQTKLDTSSQLSKTRKPRIAVSSSLTATKREK